MEKCQKAQFNEKKNFEPFGYKCTNIQAVLPDWLVRAEQEAASQGNPSQLSILCSAMYLNLCTLISFIQV